VRAIQDFAQAHNCDVLVANSDYIYENERLLCEAVVRRRVDGIIMVPSHFGFKEIDQLIPLTGTPTDRLGHLIQRSLVHRPPHLCPWLAAKRPDLLQPKRGRPRSNSISRHTPATTSPAEPQACC
jgi:hypothetical protein